MIGNPAQSDWPGFSSYVIACLPQLERLDGKEITRSMRITAQQQLPQLKVSFSSTATN
jgi:protein TilB